MSLALNSFSDIAMLPIAGLTMHEESVLVVRPCDVTSHCHGVRTAGQPWASPAPKLSPTPTLTQRIYPQWTASSLLEIRSPTLLCTTSSRCTTRCAGSRRFVSDRVGVQGSELMCALVQAKNVVLNVSEMEAKVREATNDDPWCVSLFSYGR